MDLEQLEALAFAEDRAAALAGVLPGTVEHDYWRGVHLQHAGRLDEVEEILSGWRRRHGTTDAHHARLARRQLLLRAGADPRRVADELRFEAGISLDDQAEAVVAAQRYPTRLDPAILDGEALLREALARAHDLGLVGDWALGELIARAGELDGAQRRHLLSRLTRAHLPGVVALIAADLADRSSGGFGSLAIHQALTLAQLDELARLREEVRAQPSWVAAVLTRLRPPSHVDWHADLVARRAYLDELGAFVDTLPPSFNGIRAAVLYHRLDLDRRLGERDRARFLAYLALPRQVTYVRPEWLRGVPGDQLVPPGGHAAAPAGLPPIGDDEPLVRDYLEHFLVGEDGAAFAELLRADYLERILATTRLLAGDPDAERWAAILGPAALAALRDRVELELAVDNPPRFAAEAAVALEVDVKNVPELLIKTFRIDAVAYFLARGAEVDTTIDLDGMVASDERSVASDAPAIRRVRRRVELPACARPGTYVVELIGNGRSSRALIRKGGLRHTVRVGAAGPTVRVLDDAGRPVDGARLWLGGREHAPREDGAISVPFSTTPGAAPMLLVHGDVAQREILHHPAESYRFGAGIHLEREALVPGKTARVLIRPALTVAGWPAPLALIDEPRVEIAVTDRAGTPTSRQLPLELRDDAETVVELHVPEDLAHVAITVRGSIRVESTQQRIDLADGAEAAIGQLHATDEVEAMHLAPAAGGHVLELLGKTGEPRPGRAIALSLKPIAVGFEVATTLETDERGRIELGPLPGVERVTASLPSGAQQRWRLWPELDAPRTLHVVADAAVTLPAPPAADPWLVELRGGAPARDVSDRVAVTGRVMTATGLGPGEYRLACRGLPDVHLVVVAADAPVSDGWAASGPRSVELSPPVPVIGELDATDDHVEVRLVGAGPQTRVHLVATRYRPDLALPRSLARAPRPPLVAEVAPVISHYVSGRDLGEEYRYVLERRRAPRRPGVLLDKPGLLLNPWALRTTRAAVQHAAIGGAYGASPPRPAAAPATRRAARPEPTAGAEAGFVSVDFLAAPAAVLANLVPDRDGAVRVARAELGAAQAVRAIVVDPALTSVADLGLDERATAPRDLRLRVALDPAGHFTEDRRVDGAAAGTRLVVEDVRSGKLELVDSIARAHQVLLSLGAPEPLRELGFVAEWHRLDEPTRRARYAKYACHELHLFLALRDPEFFARVVRPYLAHKRRKTFVDRWLLDEDLTGFLEPWAFGRLNALEQVLLARRIPAAREAIARRIGDAVDLIPPDPERDARLVDTLLGSTALEGGGIVAAAAPAAAMDALMAFEEQAAAPPMEADDDEAPRKERSRARRGAAPGAAPSAGGSGGDLARSTVAADLAERRRAAPMFRAADRTQEWAESDWWHVRVEDVSPALIPPNRFWRDLARHDGATPFLSPHLGECTDSFAAAMGALAVLELPHAAAAHEVVVEDTRLTLTTGSHALAARTRITAVDAADPRSPILCGQSLFRADDRWEWDGAEQREKYVTGELLTSVVYRCQVVVTNPTSRHQKLEALLQIPRGAMPVASGFYTRTAHLHLGAYGTEAIEYAFYFPAPGTWSHFGAHVTRAGELVASAPGADLVVVREPTTVDTTSWAHVSQHGSTDDVLGFLDRANLGRIDLGRIAWRMRDAGAFARVTALLAARHAYHDRLWAYALAHGDRGRMAEWLRHQDGFVRPAGPVLEHGIVALEPVERAWYQHLEYAPLINARAHQLGARRRILNDALAGQYRSFLEVVAHRGAPDDDDLLAAAHYLFAMDRIDDALAALARVDASRPATRLQHDYLAAYAACCRGDLAEARRLAAAWSDHPVDRWRHRFAALAAMLDDRTGAVDADSRDQRMAELAARQPALDLVVEGGAAVLQHHNVAAVQLRFYRMDLELLFSRQPFVQGDVERFSWIEPGGVLDLPLGGDGRTPVPLPEAMRGANLVIEAVAPGLRRAIAHYAHDLATQLADQYGQVRVLRASTQAPLGATYVKVYARHQGGDVAFYKDGYTDVRGRFDYATLSTDDLDHVERFALLVVSDDAGATVLEAAPPPR